MKKICKYPIVDRSVVLIEDGVINLPENSTILKVAEDRSEYLCLWASVLPESETEEKVIVRVVADGDDDSKYNEKDYFDFSSQQLSTKRVCVLDHTQSAARTV